MTLDRFSLNGRVAVITGGAGFLGQRHADAIAEAGGTPVLLDIGQVALELAAKRLRDLHGCRAEGFVCDITDPGAVEEYASIIETRFGHVDILINNAANNPKMERTSDVSFSRLEDFPIAQWSADINVGLTGAFLCSRSFGKRMAASRGGVILNIASDLAVIAPDQRIYREPGLTDEAQPVKPVTYSVVKSGLLGLTRYLATYWCEQGVRANALSPGGVENSQDEAFLKRVTNLIPLARLANRDEYKEAVLFLVSDASSYMNGANLVIDGGRSAW